MRRVLRGILRSVSIMALIAFAVAVGLLIQSLWQTWSVRQVNNALLEMRVATASEMADEDWSHGMLAINDDYAGWLTVSGTEVSGPVVLDESNETYLRTDIYRQPSEAGTLFLDATTDLSEGGNLIIYGHKMNDRTMFGSLDVYKNTDAWNDTATVCWESEKGKTYYTIFALMVVPGSASDEDFIDLTAWNNRPSEDQTEQMLSTIESRASIYRDVGVTAEDNFLFLVTCDYDIYNGRMVLAAVENR